MSVRKSDPRLFVLSTIPTKSDQEIRGSKLPTHSDVLKSYIAFREELVDVTSTVTTKKRDAANRTVVEVLKQYTRANIPTVAHHIMAERIIKLNTDYQTITKIPEARRDNPKPKNTIDAFKLKLTTTMPFWPKDVFRMLNKEDELFLKDMMTKRTCTMAGEDKVFKKKEEAKALRRKREQDFTEKEKARQMEDVYDYESRNSDCNNQEKECEDYEDEESKSPNPRKHRRLNKTGVQLFIPHDILKNPDVVSCSTRCNISNGSLSSLMHTVITSCGGAASKVNLHETQAFR